MPEKPEVVTVAKTLEKKLLGKHFVACKVFYEPVIQGYDVSSFCKDVCNQEIKKITTRGKWIVLQMEQKSLLIHLRMEGKFFFRENQVAKNQHEHVIFLLDDLHTTFRFHDVRKFGKMALVSNEELEKQAPLNALGYEYNDKRLTKEYLKGKFDRKTLPIKAAILDQSIIAGIGNIYDDEILFLSHISPYRQASSLSLDECALLLENTKIILEKAIKKGGTTIKSFTSEEGVHGLFQNELQVHGKKGEKCPCCGAFIKKDFIRGRGTYYCVNCQK